MTDEEVRFVLYISLEVRYNHHMDKIFSKIKKTKTCWNWTGCLVHGYGQCWFEKRQRSAPRVVYEILVGKIPQGMELDHLCFNRGCVNPKHLEPVSRGENSRRAWARRIKNSPLCKHGHPLSGNNLYTVVDKKHPGKTWRNCKTCKVLANRKWRAR